MSRIVLISCSSKKLNRSAKASEMYSSPLFKYNLKYAQSTNPDKIFILSAKYGLLEDERIIEPYNTTLNKMSSESLRAWSKKVLERLSNVADVEKDKFILLAGERYRRYLTVHMKHYEVPLKGMGIGKQLKFLKKMNSLQDLSFRK